MKNGSKCVLLLLLILFFILLFYPTFRNEDIDDFDSSLEVLITGDVVGKDYVLNDINSWIDLQKNKVKNLDDKIEKLVVDVDFSVYKNIESWHLYASDNNGGMLASSVIHYDTLDNQRIFLKDFLVDEVASDKLYTLISDKVVAEGDSVQLDIDDNFLFDEEGLSIYYVSNNVEKMKIEYADLIGIVNDAIYANSNIESAKYIAFTFDDGPSFRTNDLLDLLKVEDVKVTFFVLGSRVSEKPDVLKRIYDEGHLIGNHTYNHLNLKRVQDDVVLKEINETNELIKSLTGYKPKYLRPPYGNLKKKMLDKTGMEVVLWDIDTLDWKYRNKERVYQNIVDNAHDGAIILLHDLYQSSIDGALMAIKELKNQGYKMVTVEEMMNLKNSGSA